MIHISPSEAAPLLVRAAIALGLTQEGLGELLGASRRTVQRWQAGRTSPEVREFKELARHVYAADAQLAAEIAVACHETLESLGLVAPKPPVVAVVDAPPPRPSPLVVDAVVCAAADAVGGTPASVRAVLLAAFERAAARGLTAEEGVAGLRRGVGAAAVPRVDAPEGKGAGQTAE